MPRRNCNRTSINITCLYEHNAYLAGSFDVCTAPNGITFQVRPFLRISDRARTKIFNRSLSAYGGKIVERRKGTSNVLVSTYTQRGLSAPPHSNSILHSSFVTSEHRLLLLSEESCIALVLIRACIVQVQHNTHLKSEQNKIRFSRRYAQWMHRGE